MPPHSAPGRGLKIFLVLLALLAGIVIVCEILGWPFLRMPLQNLASKQLERDVRIEGPFKLRLLGGMRLEVGGLWIASPPVFDAPYLLDAENIKIGLRYSDLIGWDSSTEPLNIKRLEVGRMDAYMLRNAEAATWQFKKDQPDDKPAPFPNFETLAIKNGTAVVKDTVTDADLEMSFRTKEGSGESQAVSVVQAEGAFRGHPIKAHLETPGFLPAATENDSRPIPIDAWAEYGGVRGDFKGTLSDVGDSNNIKGNFTIKGPSLGILGDLFGIALPTTTEFTIKGDVAREKDLLVVGIDPARVGSSDLSGKFSFDSSGEKLVMKGDLNSSNFVLADLGPTFGTRDESGEEVTRREGRIFPDRPLNLPSLNRFNADLSLDFRRVDLGKYFALPIAPFKADLDLNSGKLSLAKIDARTAEGSLAGTIAVDAHALGESGRENPDDKSRPKPEWSMDLDWKNINLAKWIKGRAQAEPDEPNAYITGILHGNIDLKGRGNSTSELLGSLNGDISTYINQGRISHLIVEALGIDVAQALGLVIEGDQLLTMECAVVDLQSRQGIIKPEVALIDTPVTLVLMDGKVDLQQEQLDLRFVAKPENASPFTARSPILITGTFVDPNIKPKVAPIAARVLGGIALAFINPLAAIIPFLDPGSGDQSPCGEALREFNARNGKSSPPRTGKGESANDTSGSGASGGRAAGKPPAMQQPVPEDAATRENVPATEGTTQEAPDANPPQGSRGIPGHGAQ